MTGKAAAAAMLLTGQNRPDPFRAPAHARTAKGLTSPDPSGRVHAHSPVPNGYLIGGSEARNDISDLSRSLILSFPAPPEAERPRPGSRSWSWPLGWVWGVRHPHPGHALLGRVREQPRQELSNFALQAGKIGRLPYETSVCGPRQQRKLPDASARPPRVRWTSPSRRSLTGPPSTPTRSSPKSESPSPAMSTMGSELQ